MSTPSTTASTTTPSTTPSTATSTATTTTSSSAPEPAQTICTSNKNNRAIIIKDYKIGSTRSSDFFINNISSAAQCAEYADLSDGPGAVFDYDASSRYCRVYSSSQASDTNQIPGTGYFYGKIGSSCTPTTDCRVQCEQGESCSGNACTCPTQPDKVYNTLNDCGSCGNKCTDGQTCSNSVCITPAPACSANQLQCGNTCCGRGEACDGGSCSCPSVANNPIIPDYSDDDTNCGFCGNQCPDQQNCFRGSCAQCNPRGRGCYNDPGSCCPGSYCETMFYSCQYIQ
ncbi:unnamed protein product [Zymoseptoria tritici ST99CH_3D7]|uniref:Apple domain-containing protein n=1 Tax=Zymoseptoria tritici (strain ST99CH_3D7) TaxID=1276538 RepID=A0A1X7RVI6_ZYMT9|nr:unnamed protein product [Zymoseptoria tritici ST99CH_3D7]